MIQAAVQKQAGPEQPKKPASVKAKSARTTKPKGVTISTQVGGELTQSQRSRQDDDDISELQDARGLEKFLVGQIEKLSGELEKERQLRDQAIAAAATQRSLQNSQSRGSAGITPTNSGLSVSALQAAL